jgi:hypothetical protein
MSLADDARNALERQSPGRQTVADMHFPDISGRDSETQIKALEIAVAALAKSVGILIDAVDELEKRSAQ